MRALSDIPGDIPVVQTIELGNSAIRDRRIKDFYRPSPAGEGNRHADRQVGYLPHRRIQFQPSPFLMTPISCRERVCV
jgi:hypothetical protein